ncbi:flagellar hook-length control protein FliK [Sansalvadorimonas verongulae]|uniref:flagellar hook-length control protein FliK n=1 Tax=Sansalvadorimonas verongulae TaxID=2172824 RepID=UPI0012BB9E45|nr:flagellar hook-length control protein FliK [Sansalvadorimonas verongulae]MTI13259.1 flagellar hook-length control protein FliK [Sansalvadorimonas verongulae]
MDGSPAPQTTSILPLQLPLNTQSGAVTVSAPVLPALANGLPQNVNLNPSPESGTLPPVLPFDDVLHTVLENTIDSEPLVQIVNAAPAPQLAGLITHSTQALTPVNTAQPQEPALQNLIVDNKPSPLLNLSGEQTQRSVAGQLLQQPEQQLAQTTQSQLHNEAALIKQVVHQKQDAQQAIQTLEVLKPLQPVNDVLGLERPELSLDQQRLLQNTLNPVRVEVSQPAPPAGFTQAQNIDLPTTTPVAQSADVNTIESGTDRKAGAISENSSFHELLSRQSVKGEQMGERLMVMLNRDQRQATLRMDPPELGQLKVMLSVDGDQVSVQFQAGNGQLRDMLNQQVDRLRQFFEQQQMDLVNVDISHDSGLSQNDFQRFDEHASDLEEGAYENENSFAGEQIYSASPSVGRMQQGLLDVYV